MSPPKAESQPAAFLDRDGTIVTERNFLGDPNAVEIIPGVAEAIRMLNDWGFWVIGVSNQSGVARQYYGMPDVDAVNQRITDMLSAERARIDKIYYCPHHPDVQRDRGQDACRCRKPAPGMIERAQADFPIDMKRSLVIGDQASDLGLAEAVDVPGVLVLTGFGTWQRQNLPSNLTPAFIANDLLAAVRWWGRKLGYIEPAKP